jgi:hypothetical protein
MNRLNDPRLWIVVSIGVAVLGFMFADCWGGGDIVMPRQWPTCYNGFEGMQVMGIQYRWILGAAVCLILFAAYRLWDEKQRKNSN